MYRSASTNRVTDDHFGYDSKGSPSLRALALEASELPMYEPLSEAAKKEKTRARVAENAVHIIPVVLILCALILWLLSNPNINIRGDHAGANVDGMTIDGDLDSDGAEHLPMELGDIDSANKMQGDPKTLLSQNRISH